LNTAHATGPFAPEHAALLIPHVLPGHHVFTGTHAELVGLLAARTDIWVQDPASSASMAAIADLPLAGATIVDLCAGQGTKTRQLAAMFPSATIIATDLDKRRFERLERTFGGHERVRVVPYTSIRPEFLGRVDLVVLDVPCSNTGVLARRPEAKYRFGPETLESVVGVQRQIIADAIPLLRDGTSGGPRGRILYATCSLEPAENEEQAQWAAHWHRFAVERESRVMPTGGPGQPATAYTDGSYAALLG
jgi:16S rRNA (cytosine967-C5)-methyltransferase